MRTCPKCGYKIENDKALFCRQCGNDVRDVLPESTSEEQEQSTVSKEDVHDEAISEETGAANGGILLGSNLRPDSTQKENAFNGNTHNNGEQ